MKLRKIIKKIFSRNLINFDKSNLPNSYAKVYLRGEEKKISKKSTKVIKNCLFPKWEEIFCYTMTFAEAYSKILYIKLKDQKGIFEKQETTFLGEVRSFFSLKMI